MLKKNVKRGLLFLLILMLCIQPFLALAKNKVVAAEDFAVNNLKAQSDMSTREVKLQWDPLPNADGYYIFRMFEGDDSMPYIAYTLKPEFNEVPEKGGFVYYLVIPFEIVGGQQVQGSYDQNTFSYTAPPATEALSLTVQDDQVKLQWMPSSGASEYLVKRRAKNEAKETLIGKTKAIQFIDETAFDYDDGTALFYNVYPVFQGRGVTLQGQNEQYVFTLISKDNESIDPPEVPDEPDLPDEPDTPDEPDLPDEPDKPDEPQTPGDVDLQPGELAIGEWWEVPGLWRFKIVRVERTTERNPKEKQNPAEVITMHFMYENLGYTKKNSLTFHNWHNIQVRDEKGVYAPRYELPKTDSGIKDVPVGAVSKNEVKSFALKNPSDEITVLLKHKGNGERMHRVIYRIALTD